MLRSTRGPGRDVLYRAEAVDRAACVHEVSYQLLLELSESRDTYTGKAVVDFRLRSVDGPVFLDLTGRPSRLVLNGTILEPDHHDHRLWLPAQGLAPANRVVVEYESSFDLTGDGFHRFQDPEDGETYLYSNFEPFSAHRLFPCFDQPDIKASYRLSVIAPASWRVVSAETPGQAAVLPDGRCRHDFPVTPPFSSYLFPLIAGPYERIGSEHRGTALGLLGRRSMWRELERSAEEIFEITCRGLDHYADLFGRPYPFTKYEQAFVPEFNAGAMENVGAVTFHDRYLFRDPPTYRQRLARGEVILHELAHMWFGNLVTMRWWDDLWLNETFATYLSYRCLADATSFADAWQAFNGDLRPAAHRQDQLVTTHPIATAVEHTDEAVGNFDAITYEKGAAVIRQLVAAIGDDAFRAGLGMYFDRHAWGNATLADFLGALGDAAKQPLERWAGSWLRSASLNTLGVRWSSADGRITEMELQQVAPSTHPTLRPHATRLGLVWERPGQRTLAIDSIAVHIDGEMQPVPEAVGRVAPVFVYPNLDDLDYALVRLDPVSLSFALERLPELPDPLLRQQVWSTLWEMVRGATLRSSDYLDAVRRFTPGETDRALLGSVLERATEVLRRFVPEQQSRGEAHALLTTAIAALCSTQDDLRLTWVRAACGIAADGEDVTRLLGLVDDSWSIDGFVLDQELRWSLVIKAAAFDLDGVAGWLVEERRRDRSDRGQRASIRAMASRPDSGAKAEAWECIHGAGYGSDYLTRAAIAGFQWHHQRALLEPFRAPFYEQVGDVFATRDHAYATAYLRSLVPDRWAEPTELQRIREFRAGLGEGQGLLGRQLDEIADDLARDIQVRAYAEGAVGADGAAVDDVAAALPAG